MSDELEFEIRPFPGGDAEQVRLVAGWHQAEWGHLSDRTEQDRIREFASHGAAIPQTVLAYLDGAPVGSASLLEHDLDVRLDLTPWLASVYVKPALRRRGIGRALVARIVAEAARLGVETLYLFTEDRAHFYRQMGWEVVEQSVHAGQPITVMRIAPSAAR